MIGRSTKFIDPLWWVHVIFTCVLILVCVIINYWYWPRRPTELLLLCRHWPLLLLIAGMGMVLSGNLGAKFGLHLLFGATSGVDPRVRLISLMSTGFGVCVLAVSIAYSVGVLRVLEGPSLLGPVAASVTDGRQSGDSAKADLPVDIVWQGINREVAVPLAIELLCVLIISGLFAPTVAGPRRPARAGLLFVLLRVAAVQILIVFDMFFVGAVFSYVAWRYFPNMAGGLNLDWVGPWFTTIPDKPSAQAVWMVVCVQLAELLILLIMARKYPAIALCVLVSFAGVGYELLCIFRPEYRFGAFVLILGLIIALGGSYYRRRFPGMDQCYESPVRLDEVEREVEKGHIPPGPNPGLLNDRSILESWAMSLRQGRAEKPRLVLVTVTGGAYRAAFWTTLVLEKLSTIDEAFLTHVRLITGASGGMVGAAYMVCRKMCDDAHTSSTECLKEETSCDSLTPVVSQFVRGDLLRSLWPFVAQKKDRGVVLEDQWKSLNVTFNSLREKEKLGELPSLVISPMIVETGSRLLISNLDLHGLTEHQARSRDGVSREEADGSRENKPTYRLYSRSAVEFFRAFPESYEKFKVKTAVRISASFPYISPVVSLPVDPPRESSTPDITTITASASPPSGRTSTTTGSRRTRPASRSSRFAHSDEVARKSLWGAYDAPSGFAKLLRRFIFGVYGLTTPFRAALSAYQWSMSYRNDEQLSLLEAEFNSRKPGSGPANDSNGFRFFETFVFENPIDSAMNWFIDPSEIERMADSLARETQSDKDDRAHKHNKEQLLAFEKWWSHGRESPEAGVSASDLPASAS